MGFRGGSTLRHHEAHLLCTQKERRWQPNEGQVEGLAVDGSADPHSGSAVSSGFVSQIKELSGGSRGVARDAPFCK